MKPMKIILRGRTTAAVMRHASWLATVLLVGAVQAAPPDDPYAGKRYTVEAGVESAPGAFIRAQQKTGPFTVPTGYRATSFKYHFADVQTGYESDKLRAGNIRALRGGHVGLDAGEEGFSLGPGDYVFVVGGLPGAVGSLSYVLERAEDVAGTDVGTETKSGDRVIDVTTWSPQSPESKLTIVYFVHAGNVRGELDHAYEIPKSDTWTCEPMRTKGTFTGTISGNVINGTWQCTLLPYRMHFFANATTPAFDRVDSGKSTFQTRLVLYADGTVSETSKGGGTSVSDWGPTAPGDVAGKHLSSTYEVSIPGENHPEPLTGTWKNRN
jgi:hypothetical protein